MKTSSASDRVVMFDPGCFIPYYVDSLCRSLAALGQRVRVVTSPPLFEPVEPHGSYGVDRFFFPFLRGIVRDLVRHHARSRQALKGISYPHGLFRTWRALRSGPPGVFHLQWAPFPLFDRLLVRALKARGWRVVYTQHDPLPAPDRRARRRHHLELLRLSDAVIVHTLNQRDELASAVPDVTDRLHVIAHGGTRSAPPTMDGRARCRERLGVDGDRPVILFFGLIKPYKGLDRLVAAMAGVVAELPRALLLVAGEPLMSLDAIERQIDELGLRDNVSMRLGFVPSHDVRSYLGAADLLVTPYVSIGASGVLVMAQEHGLPAVVTRVGGLPEFVEPDDCGFVVPAGDSDALADAIRRALLDRTALARMGERARRRIARDSAWPDVAERTLAVYGTSTPMTSTPSTAGDIPVLSRR
jgi:glycosyltransferase involved in cell wall biosynthesis